MESTRLLSPPRSLESAFRLFIESVKDYAIFMLDPTGHVMTWNVGAERLKGYTADDILGSHFSRFYPESDVQARKPERVLAIAAAEGRVEDEGWRIRKDGSRFWAYVVITAVRDEHGTLIAFGKVTRDMTGLRAREEENARLTAREQAHSHELEELVAARTKALEEANRELRQANEALETFAQTIAHDLRGPLRTIRGFADILLAEHATTLNEEGRDYLARVAGAATRLSDLVQNLLAFARVTRPDAAAALHRVSWDRLVEVALRELHHDVERTHTTLTVRGPLGDVVAHRDTLALVLHNLMTNAMKFVPAGVVPRLELWTDRRGDRLRLNLRDNGVGVAPESQERIFKPFERLHGGSTYHGTGLGLAIVAQAIPRLGGTYGVESDGRTGSCFWVELPAAPAEGH